MAADTGMKSSDLLEHTKMECDSSSPELDPELAEEDKLKGNEAYKAGDYTTARDCYSKAIFHNPNCASYWSNRSASLMMLKNYSMALDDCTQALKLDETYTKGYLRAAKCHLMTGNPSLSIDYYKKVLAVEKRNKQALAELLVSQRILKNLEEAAHCTENKQYRMGVVLLQRCLEEAPQCLVFRTKLAEALILSKNYSEAHGIANDLLKSDQNNATALYVKAMCYYYQDVPDRAILFFQQALRVDPDHTKSRLAMKQSKHLLKMKEEGNSLFKEGKHAEAYKIYSEALEVDSHNTLTNAKLYCNRALVGAKIGKLEEAIQDCTNAIELDEGYIRAYQRRAKLYQENENHDEAVRDYEFLLKKERSSENKANLMEAKKLLKLSKRKDYYKILGISKSASGEEIKKAYRKSALLHHPDRHVSADEAARVEEERIFKEVSEAYSVLSDTGKRSRYDNGQDLDQMSDMDFDPSSMFSSMFGGSFGGGGGGDGFGHGGSSFFSYGYAV